MDERLATNGSLWEKPGSIYLFNALPNLSFITGVVKIKYYLYSKQLARLDLMPDLNISYDNQTGKVLEVFQK